MERNDEVARRVLESAAYLGTRPTEQTTLGELAARARMSKFHYLRSFRRVMGVTPMRYAEQCRLAFALSLLVRGHSAAFAAFAAGFADQPHFTRRFKSVMGMTPGQFVLHARDGLEAPVRNHT